MPRRIVFATGNKHKVEEVSAILGESIELVGLKDIGCLEDIPETQPSIAGNAIQKAEYIRDNYQMDCFSEDTGLEIEALDGAPGVRSARYAGEDKDSEANMSLVLEKLAQQENRKARFKTVIALILDGKTMTFEGIVNGKILPERKGEKGFGYDPIFQPEGYEESFAEMGAKEKNKISHRAIAVNKLIQFLQRSTEIKL